MDSHMEKKDRIQLSDHFTYSRLLRFVVSPIANMIFLSVYGIVDGLFISNFVGKVPFACINMVFPVFSILGVFGLMIGTGGSAVIGKTLGERENEKAKGIFSFFVIVCFLVGVVMAVVGVVTLKPVLVLLGAKPNMMGYCMTYGLIGMATVPFFMLQFFFQILFVTAEKPRLGFWITIIAGVTNIAFDALFIIVFKWGIVGAAIATCMGEFVGGVIPVIYFIRPNDSLLRLVKPITDMRILGKACVNGSSEFVSTVSESFVTMLYNFQLMRLIGSDGVAAFGVMQYATFIFFAIFAGYNMALQPVISFNYGAQNKAELKNLFRKSLILIEGGGLAMFGILIAFARILAAVFVGYDESLLELTTHAIRIYSLLFITCGVNIFITGMFTALNNGIVSAICATVRVIIFECGSVLILPMFFGVNGIWFSAPVAEVGSIIVVLAFTIGLRKRYGYV